MKQQTQRRWWSGQRAAFLGVFVAGLFLFSGPAGAVDQAPPEKKKDKDKGSKVSNVVRSGFTRPGEPEDPMGDDGALRPLAHDPALAKLKGKLLGGTIYFMVLMRTDSEEDPWNFASLGVNNFADRFAPGKSFKGTFSPQLDNEAKYLYLYMIVNDRGLDPTAGRVALAAGVRDVLDKKVSDIASTAIKLIVDPRYITSWGYFKASSFTAEVPDTFGAEHKPVADNQAQKIRMAVSANTSFLDMIPERDRRYMDEAPARPFRDLRTTISIGASNENGTRTNLYKELVAKRDKSKIKLAAYEDHLLNAAMKGGKVPDFVQLLYSGFEEKSTPTLESSSGFTVFRADFRGNNGLALGEHSVLFGFTSDLPPTDGLGLIQDPEAAQRGNGLVRQGKPAQDPLFVSVNTEEEFVQGASGGTTAPGTVPTPTGGGLGLPTAVNPFGSLGGGSGSGGGGGAGFPGAGGIGAPRTAGFFGGGGSGQQGQGQTPNQNQNQTSPNQDQNQQQGNTFNITLSQQQTQSQSQSQSQQQSNCCCNNNQNVVPAPPAFLLGLLGLPAFYFLRRRKAEELATA